MWVCLWIFCTSGLSRKEPQPQSFSSDSNVHLCPLVAFRCVKGEGEIEKLQTKVVEMRRKLEDTTAAMQELGRENQSLQVSHQHPAS